MVRVGRFGVLSFLVLAIIGACEGNSTVRRRGSDAGAPPGDDSETGGATPSGGALATGGSAPAGGRSGRGGSAGVPTGGTTGAASGTGGGSSAGDAGEPSGGTAGTAGDAGAAGEGGMGACGNYDEPCCNRVTCRPAEAVCTRSPQDGGERYCRRCGVPGMPCCTGSTDGEYRPRRCDGGCCIFSGDYQCVAPMGRCPYGDSVCEADGTCTQCGGPGAPCCGATTHPWCPLPGTTCALDAPMPSCVPCGALGEPCCVATELVTPPTAACNPMLECDTPTMTCVAVP